MSRWGHFDGASPGHFDGATMGKAALTFLLGAFFGRTDAVVSPSYGDSSLLSETLFACTSRNGSCTLDNGSALRVLQGAPCCFGVVVNIAKRAGNGRIN